MGIRMITERETQDELDRLLKQYAQVSQERELEESRINDAITVHANSRFIIPDRRSTQAASRTVSRRTSRALSLSKQAPMRKRISSLRIETNRQNAARLAQIEALRAAKAEVSQMRKDLIFAERQLSRSSQFLPISRMSINRREGNAEKLLQKMVYMFPELEFHDGTRPKLDYLYKVITERIEKLENAVSCNITNQ